MSEWNESKWIDTFVKMDKQTQHKFYHMLTVIIKSKTH